MLLPKEPHRRPLLALTPLIDVLFLLLIFFMLSSQVAPYSLIPLGGVFHGGGAESRPQEAIPVAAPVVLRVSHGYVTLGRERTAITDLKEAVEELRQQDIDRYLVIPTATANVQDMVSVLEVLKMGAAAEVTLINSGGGRQ
ncbi:biopolymer transporter ExbD [Chelativorans salis]|uniref:Biopolymer transporter ExbD n=1 Tax=Chelativorans salis TaxID=2978478 RepID=A0ABT2LKD0_9HYPH|nr:biopolymer transporter ExbD [Chelativorans sp. EGI FJ00035]MCT7374128.1 biopolymer transporter ExbD [Chelativorans sp. EGI FJ00035]